MSPHIEPAKPFVLWGRFGTQNLRMEFASLAEAQRYVTDELQGRNRRTVDNHVEFDVPGNEQGTTVIIQDKRNTPVDSAVDYHRFLLCGDDLPAVQERRLVGRGFDSFEEANGFVERELNGFNVRRESDIIHAYDVPVGTRTVTVFIKDRMLAGDWSTGSVSGY